MDYLEGGAGSRRCERFLFRADETGKQGKKGSQASTDYSGSGKKLISTVNRLFVTDPSRLSEVHFYVYMCGWKFVRVYDFISINIVFLTSLHVGESRRSHSFIFRMLLHSAD